jgi:hypothetical protein
MINDGKSRSFLAEKRDGSHYLASYHYSRIRIFRASTRLVWL